MTPRRWTSGVGRVGWGGVASKLEKRTPLLSRIRQSQCTCSHSEARVTEITNPCSRSGLSPARPAPRADRPRPSGDRGPGRPAVRRGRHDTGAARARRSRSGLIDCGPYTIPLGYPYSNKLQPHERRDRFKHAKS